MLCIVMASEIALADISLRRKDCQTASLRFNLVCLHPHVEHRKINNLTILKVYDTKHHSLERQPEMTSNITNRRQLWEPT